MPLSVSPGTRELTDAVHEPAYTRAHAHEVGGPNGAVTARQENNALRGDRGRGVGGAGHLLGHDLSRADTGTPTPRLLVTSHGPTSRSQDTRDVTPPLTETPPPLGEQTQAGPAAHPGLCTMSRSTRTASSLLMFSKFTSFTWKPGQRVRGRRGPQPYPPPRGPGPAHLQQHVARLDAPVGRHGAPLHDGADVDAAVAPLVALAHDGDAQEVVLLCGGGAGDRGQPAARPPGPRRPGPRPGSPVPMLSVTVMMLRDMVESVTLLKDEACRGNGEGAALPPTTQGRAPGCSLPVPSYPLNQGPRLLRGPAVP